MSNLSKNFRIRAAILVALAYAFCVLAPSAALAFTDSPTAFQCLSELDEINAPSQHEGAGHTHMDGVNLHHVEGSATGHHSDLGHKGHAGSCCGLFCISGLAHDPGLTFGVSVLASSQLPFLAKSFAGRSPSPLHRPPID
jgi:hypothetical protein